jgi:glutamyl-tRNA(Gln) amidotransferase subunit E
MYPDTDSAPIPLSSEYIESLRQKLPNDIIERYNQLKDWDIAEDTYTYLFSKNLYPMLQKTVEQLDYSAKEIGNFLGHTLKNIEGQYTSSDEFDYDNIYELFAFIKNKNLDLNIAKSMMVEWYQHPKMDFDSVLSTINFKAKTIDDIIEQIPFLVEKYSKIGRKQGVKQRHDWVMGQLRKMSKGNISFSELSEIVSQEI